VQLQELTQAATAPNEEVIGPQHAPATPSARVPGKRPGTMKEERRASEHRSDVVEEDSAPRRRLGTFFQKTKESDNEDLERVKTLSYIQRNDTFWHRCLRRAGLQNDRSIGVPIAGIGASVVADGPSGTLVWDERIAIFDMDRQNGSNNGTSRRLDPQCLHRG